MYERPGFIYQESLALRLFSLRPSYDHFFYASERAVSYPTPGGLSAISRKFTTIYVRATAGLSAICNTCTGFAGPWCPIDDDPWVSDAPYFSFWSSNYDGTAEPVIHLGDDITENGAFNVGDDNAECGVKGHAVIVHKGCPASEPNCNDGGARIGCCVLA